MLHVRIKSISYSRKESILSCSNTVDIIAPYSKNVTLLLKLCFTGLLFISYVYRIIVIIIESETRLLRVTNLWNNTNTFMEYQNVSPKDYSQMTNVIIWRSFLPFPMIFQILDFVMKYFIFHNRIIIKIISYSLKIFISCNNILSFVQNII